MGDLTIVEEGIVKVTRQGIEELLKNSGNWKNEYGNMSTTNLGVIVLQEYHHHQSVKQEPKEAFDVVKNVSASEIYSCRKDYSKWIKD